MSTKAAKSSSETSSRFGGIKDRAKHISDLAEPETLASSPTAAPVPPSVPPTEVAAKNRKPGKKEHPDYVQVTVYLRKDTYAAARKILFDDRKQFSDLTEELVSTWLAEMKL